MTDYHLFLIQIFTGKFLGYIISGNLILLILFLLIAVVSIAIYSLLRNSKKSFSSQMDNLKKEIGDLKMKHENQTKELAGLNAKLDEGINRMRKLEQEKETLILEKKALEEQILQFGNHESKEKEDIIIEYYMNEKPGSYIT